MRCKDISFKSPEENILYDELLLQLAEEGVTGETLRFWESDQVFVVLGRISKQADDLCMENVLKDRIRVLRRASGGGTVLQGRGSFNYTLVLSKDAAPIRDLKRSYAHILGCLVKALATMGINAAYFPISDLALADGERKFSGNAQKRGRHFILHHGTMLLDYDLSLMDRYLAMPKDIPEYRRMRPHADFVCNLGADRRQLKSAIRSAFGAGVPEEDLKPSERERLDQLLASKDIEVSLGSGTLL